MEFLKSRVTKRHVLPLVAVVLVWTLIVGLAASNAYAESYATFNTFQISVSSSGKVEVAPTTTGFSVTLYGKTESGSCGSSNNSTVEATLTITNTGKKPDGSVRGVTFKITTSGTKADETAAEKTLDGSTTSIEYKATSGNGSSASTVVKIDFADIVQESLGANVTTTVKPGVGGTITVDDTLVTSQTDFSMADTHVYTLTAIPDAGYIFFGWVSDQGHVNTDGTASVRYPAPNASTVWPMFVKEDSAIYQLGNAYFGYLDQATAAAGSSGTIVVSKSGTVYHSDGTTNDFTIPKGVTLLVPFDDANTLITNNMGVNVNTEYTAPPAKTLYRQLIMTSGTSITVYGAINVGSRAVCQMAGQVGPYGAIVMDDGSNITVKNGGTLYAYGYIFHGTTGSGTITVESGGTVYEDIMIMDYPNSSGSTLDLYDNGLFPLRAYTVRNVEVPMTFHSGANEYVFYCLYGDRIGTHYGNILFISSDSTAPLQIKSGATLTKSYYDGVQYIVFNGSAGLNSISLTIKSTLITKTVSTSNTSGVPIPSGWDITVASGTMTLGDNVIAMEGAKITINEDATIDANGKNMYVLDALEDPGAPINWVYFSTADVHGKIYTQVDADAIVDVNGTLIVNAGFYTSASGASIISSKGTGEIRVTSTSADTSINIKYDVGSYTACAVTAAKLKNANGDYVTISAGTYRYCGQHWYSGNGCSTCCNHAETTTTTVDPTCTETGSVIVTCNGCGTVISNTPISASGHSMVAGIVVAPTCTADGYTIYTCSSGCSHTENKDVVGATGHTAGEAVRENEVSASCHAEGSYEEVVYCSVEGCGAEIGRTAKTIEKIDHTAGAEATCTTAQTCTLCGAVLEAATGVHYDSATDADHFCDNGCNKVMEGCVDSNKDYLCDICGDTMYIRPAGATLLYKDMIQIRYKFTVNLSDVVEYGMWIFGGETDEEARAAAYTFDAAYAKEIHELKLDSGSTYYGFSNGISAKNMGDAQYMVTYVKLADGSYRFTAPVEYSPKQYALNMVGKETTSEKTKALCQALMHYGAAHQLYTGYRVDDLMNVGFGDFVYDASVLGESVFSVDTSVVNGMKSNGATLIFTGALTYRFKYTPSAEALGKQLYAEYTVNVNGETVKQSVEIATDSGYAFVSGIPAKDMDSTITIQPYYLNEQGERVYGPEVVYSGYEYCRRTIENSSNEASINLAKAFAMYVYAANAAM